MWNAMERELVLTKSANAEQDGIRRKIARVSALNQTYLSKVLAKTSSLEAADWQACSNSNILSFFVIILSDISSSKQIQCKKTDIGSCFPILLLLMMSNIQ